MDWKYSKAGTNETWLIMVDGGVEAGVEKSGNFVRFRVTGAKNHRNLGYYATLEDAKAAALSYQPVSTMVHRLPRDARVPEFFIGQASYNDIGNAQAQHRFPFVHAIR